MLHRFAADALNASKPETAEIVERQKVIREQMAGRIEQLKSELESDAAAGQRRKQAARLRAATEREERCRKALVRLRELEIERDARKSKGDPKDKKGVRASTTDAEARVMKMPDGGFRPAYNVQVAGDPDSQVIVGVAIDTRGCDVGQLRPMLEQLQDRYGRTPSWYLADGGFRQFADIDWAWSHDTAAVIPAQGRDGKDPYAPRPGDGPGVTVWRELMSGALGQRMYRVRSQLECLFAQMRQRAAESDLVIVNHHLLCADAAVQTAARFALTRTAAVGVDDAIVAEQRLRTTMHAPQNRPLAIGVDVFAEGEMVKVTGTSKGRGFQGVVNISVEPNAVAAGFGEVTVQPEDAVALVRSDGHILARRPGFSTHQARITAAPRTGHRIRQCICPDRCQAIAGGVTQGIEQFEAIACEDDFNRHAGT